MLWTWNIPDEEKGTTQVRFKLDENLNKENSMYSPKYGISFIPYVQNSLALHI